LPWPSADGHSKNICFVLTCRFRKGFGINDFMWITASCKILRAVAYCSCTLDEEHPINTFHVKRCTFSGKCSWWPDHPWGEFDNGNQAKFVCKGVLGSLNFDVMCGRVCCGEGVWLVARLGQPLNVHETTYCSTMLLYLGNVPGLRTIVLLLHCRIMNMHYNILQYFNSAIQYIAILQIDNTIYCNSLVQQYNILQYFRLIAQYIAIL
jgi:hypothetical protein